MKRAFDLSLERIRGISITGLLVFAYEISAFRQRDGEWSSSKITLTSKCNCSRGCPSHPHWTAVAFCLWIDQVDLTNMAATVGCLEDGITGSHCVGVPIEQSATFP